MLPEKQDSLENQKEYKKNRDNGIYVPLLGGSDKGAQDNGRPGGAKAPQLTKKISPKGTGLTSKGFGVKRIVDNLVKGEKIKEILIGKVKEKWNISELNEQQNMIVETLAKSIIVNENEENWTEISTSYLDTPKAIGDEDYNNINEIAVTYDVDPWTAAILFKSQI
jgi:hypothetical protein